MCELPENKSSIYPTTQWTQIIEVIRKGDDEESLAALGQLFEQYRPAIYAFFNRYKPARAEDLTNAFFETRVIVPWNRRHGTLSPFFETEDICRVTEFKETLRQRSRPLTEYLWSVLSDSTRELICASNPTAENESDLRRALASDLNAILKGPVLYEERRFADVEFSLESRNFIGKQLTSRWAIWFNRSLLGDAFSRHLTKGIGFLYLVEREENRKFRTYLAHAMWWFLKDTTRAEFAQAAGGGCVNASLEGLAEIGIEVADRLDEKFGRQLDEEFARQVFTLASSKFQHSKQLQDHLWGRISQKDAAEALGLSENTFRQCYFRFRRRLADALYDEVATLVGPGKDEILAEMNYLVRLLGK